ncbi:MAG: hypothetical protein J6T48_10660 [Bacteroidales bacterium]|nr:hypothetical protein [Bacteroidales bacterium]
MRRIILALLFAVASMMLLCSCEKDCTCSRWTDGKNTDTNPMVYTQDEINSLNAKNCAGLNNYYASLGHGYDEATGSGIRCE